MSPMNNAELAKPFVQATIYVISSLTGIVPKAGTPYVNKNRYTTGDISAVVGVTGDRAGNISLCFSKKCAVAIVKAMLGDDIEDILRDTKDTVGEITNMVSGHARANLTELGLTLNGSTPSIIMGDNHTIVHASPEPTIAIPFSTEHGDFVVEFSFEG
jgi:chemotaxis protein CheX